MSAHAGGDTRRGGPVWPHEVDREKLVRCLALLTSPYDGEALAAARAAHRLVHATGRNWRDVIGAQPAPSPQLRTYTYIPHDWPMRWRWVACACLDSGRVGHPHDKRFLRAIVKYATRPRPEKLERLHAIANHALAGTWR